MYTRNYSSRYGEKAYNGENTAPQSAEQTEVISPNSENGGQVERTAPVTNAPEKTHPQSAEINPEIEVSQEIQNSDKACDDTQAEVSETQSASNIPRKRAVRTFKVRSSPRIAPPPDDKPEFSDCDDSKSEIFDVTRNCENAEKDDFFESTSADQCQSTADAQCAPAKAFVSGCGDESRGEDSACRHSPKHRPIHKPDRNGEKNFFPSNTFGLKNLSYEDIFLCAIMLLLINEGCEDIMILILGFLLIS